MSELSELIKINKNIENQNKEIIRLLKIISGESQDTEDSDTSHVEGTEEVEFKDLLVEPLGVGEVYFLDENELFKLSAYENKIVINNLMTDKDCRDFYMAGIVGNASLDLKQALDTSVCILNNSSKGRLAQSLKILIDNGAKKAMIPWDQTMELLGAPQELQFLIKLDFYRTEEDLKAKLFI